MIASVPLCSYAPVYSLLYIYIYFRNIVFKLCYFWCHCYLYYGVDIWSNKSIHLSFWSRCIYRMYWLSLLNLISWNLYLYHATVSGSWFQRMTVSTKKLYWYWAVLLFGLFKHFELLVLYFSTGLMVTQSPNVFGFICLLRLLNVTKASVGRAGTNPQPPCTLK
jgi:hypothetical protein